MLLFVTYLANQNEILHTSWQKYCCVICKIMLWSFEDILNQSTENFDRISVLAYQEMFTSNV